MKKLEQIIRNAGDILMSYFGKADIGKEFKAEKDLVSDADRHSERYLMEELSRIDNIEFLSEEYNPLRGFGGKPLWIIDPLDGTTNFLAHLTPFAISVAHYNGIEVDYAACYIPPYNEYFFAQKGGGAFMNGTPIRVSSESEAINAVAACGFADVTKNLPKNTLPVLNSVIMKTRALRRPGSAVTDLLYTARGSFEFFWEYGLSPWDVAAGALIVKEAGGIVTDFNGGDDFIANHSIIASNRGLYDFIREEIKNNFVNS